MWFGALGPLEVRDDSGALVDIGGRQPRVVLGVLLAAGGRSVSADALIDAIWGDEPPASAAGTLQSYVSRLRRHVGAAVVVWDERGYRLDAAADAVDFRRFEALVDEGRNRLEAGDPAGASAALGQAESLWRGPAFSELADIDLARGPAARLDERRVAALEDRVDADLALGRHAAVVAELTELVATHPLRERLWAQLGLALYRSGRQADALRALSDAGRTLREELGIEPSRPLRELEQAILEHDPALDVRPPRRSPTPAPSGARSSLVGRDVDLDQLVTALDESTTSARFVVVEGEPGIGKTRLADELRAVALGRGATVAWGRSDEGGAAPALWPWLAPLRALGAPFAELLAGDAAGPAALAASARFERFEAVADRLGRVTADQQVVILIDDLQWADEASLELLAFLTNRAEPGLLVVATMRQLELGRRDAVTDALAALARRPGSRRIRLRGLDEAATAALLASSAGRVLPAETVTAIHRRAEGNPFYAIELARLLEEEGGRSEVPGNVADVIRRRVSLLPAATADALATAAVIGRDVDLGLLARVAEVTLDESADVVEPALVHRLLVTVPEHPAAVRFSHALVREVLLDGLSPLRRARLHLRVADAIEASGAGVDDAEILAEHLFRAAAVGGGQRAAEALERAAEVAVRRVAYGTAEDLLQRAVQLRRLASGTPAEQESELLAICRLIEVARARRYYSGAAGFGLLDRAKVLAERCNRRDVLLDLLWVEWAMASTSCRLDDGEPLVRTLAELAAGDPEPVRRAQGLCAWGVHQWGRGRVTEAWESVEAAEALFLGAEHEGRFTLATEQRMLGTTFVLLLRAIVGAAEPDRIHADFEDLVAAQNDRFATASVLGFMATAAMVGDDWATVDSASRRLLAIDPGNEFGFWHGQALLEQAIALAWRGEADDAIAMFEDGRAAYTAVQARSALASYSASVARHLASHGRVEDAARIAEDAREELTRYEERWNEPIVLLAEAAVAVGRGDAVDAAERRARAIAVAVEQGSHGVAARARRDR